MNEIQAELGAISKRWQLERVLGQGSYGVVLKAYDTHTHTHVAIKRVHKDIMHDNALAVRILREVSLLRHFNVAHVLKLKHFVMSTKEKGGGVQGMFIVTNLMDTDLKTLLASHQELSMEHVNYLTYQILAGLLALHRAGVVHRDLTPANVLVDVATCDLKIGDLGLARDVREGDGVMTDYVTVRWYRAPEVLCGAQTYGPAVDVWAAGCILAELLGSDPIFPGTCAANQLSLIVAAIGAPSPSCLQNMRASKQIVSYVRGLPGVGGAGGGDKRGSPMFLVSNAEHVEAARLMRSMLVFDPDARVTVEEALKHPLVSAHVDDETTGMVVPRFDTRRSALNKTHGATTQEIQTELFKIQAALGAQHGAAIAAAVAAAITIAGVASQTRLLVFAVATKLTVVYDSGMGGPEVGRPSIQRTGGTLCPRAVLHDTGASKLHLTATLHPETRWSSLSAAISSFFSTELRGARSSAGREPRPPSSATASPHVMAAQLSMPVLPALPLPPPARPGVANGALEDVPALPLPPVTDATRVNPLHVLGTPSDAAGAQAPRRGQHKRGQNGTLWASWTQAEYSSMMQGLEDPLAATHGTGGSGAAVASTLTAGGVPPLPPAAYAPLHTRTRSLGEYGFARAVPVAGKGGGGPQPSSARQGSTASSGPRAPGSFRRCGSRDSSPGASPEPHSRTTPTLLPVRGGLVTSPHSTPRSGESSPSHRAHAVSGSMSDMRRVLGAAAAAATRRRWADRKLDALPESRRPCALEELCYEHAEASMEAAESREATMSPEPQLAKIHTGAATAAQRSRLLLGGLDPSTIYSREGSAEDPLRYSLAHGTASVVNASLHTLPDGMSVDGLDAADVMTPPLAPTVARARMDAAALREAFSDGAAASRPAAAVAIPAPLQLRKADVAAGAAAQGGPTGAARGRTTNLPNGNGGVAASRDPFAPAPAGGRAGGGGEGAAPTTGSKILASALAAAGGGATGKNTTAIGAGAASGGLLPPAAVAGSLASGIVHIPPPVDFVDARTGACVTLGVSPNGYDLVYSSSQRGRCVAATHIIVQRRGGHRQLVLPTERIAATLPGVVQAAGGKTSATDVVNAAVGKAQAPPITQKEMDGILRGVELLAAATSTPFEMVHLPDDGEATAGGGGRVSGAASSGPGTSTQAGGVTARSILQQQRRDSRTGQGGSTPPPGPVHAGAPLRLKPLQIGPYDVSVEVGPRISHKADSVDLMAYTTMHSVVSGTCCVALKVRYALTVDPPTAAPAPGVHAADLIKQAAGAGGGSAASLQAPKPPGLVLGNGGVSGAAANTSNQTATRGSRVGDKPAKGEPVGGGNGAGPSKSDRDREKHQSNDPFSIPPSPDQEANERRSKPRPRRQTCPEYDDSPECECRIL